MVQVHISFACEWQFVVFSQSSDLLNSFSVTCNLIYVVGQIQLSRFEWSFVHHKEKYIGEYISRSKKQQI